MSRLWVARLLICGLVLFALPVAHAARAAGVDALDLWDEPSASSPGAIRVVRVERAALDAAGYSGQARFFYRGMVLEPVIKHPLRRASPAADRLERSFVVVGGAAPSWDAAAAEPAGEVIAGVETLEVLAPGAQHAFFGDLDGDATARPNDPLFLNQRSLIAAASDAAGDEVGVGVLSAWSINTGAHDNGDPVVIAVLDARVAEAHPELEGVLLEGYNAIEGGTDTNLGSDWHGTHISGLVAARANNFEGIAGISWGARVLPVRVVNDFGFGTAAWFADGLTWAADAGADVANISLGYPVGSSIMEDAITYAFDAGMVIVASSGNTPAAPVSFPAAYSPVIAVGATDAFGFLWPNTSVGPELDLVAPGVDIFSLFDSPANRLGYGTATGTSFAAPHVTGIVALMIAANPELTPTEIRGVLTSTGTAGPASASTLNDSYPRVDGLAAVAIAAASVSQPSGCEVDLNGDGMVDVFDVLLFLNLVDAGDPAVDLAPPEGVIDLFDVLVFLGLFGQPCSG
ncbi:MAG: S8 family serine peptidase [Planctomycetota bacterium]